MDKVQRNAIAFERLLHTEYRFCLTNKGKGVDVHLGFSKEDFHHLQGFSQLKDLQIHSISGIRSFESALSGRITEFDIQKSELLDKTRVQQKIDYLYLLEDAIDKNDVVFKYRKNSNSLSRIEARILLHTKMQDINVFLFMDTDEPERGIYFSRSFVVETDPRKIQARTRNQTKLTVLWKEKINKQTLESAVLYQYKDFTQEQLNINRYQV